MIVLLDSPLNNVPDLWEAIKLFFQCFLDSLKPFLQILALTYETARSFSFVPTYIYSVAMFSVIIIVLCRIVGR